jgi:signal peptidase I
LPGVGGSSTPDLFWSAGQGSGPPVGAWTQTNLSGLAEYADIGAWTRDNVNNEMDNAGDSPGWLKRAIIGRNPRRTLVRAVVLGSACFVVFHYLLIPVQVVGLSMWPTYRDRQINFANRLAYARHKPRRGDVVCLQLSAGRHVMYLKRIIGLPGETVEFRGGCAYVNNQPLVEPYVRTECDWDLPPKRLGTGEYYVVGDNRGMPAALHEQGVMDRRLIVGKPLL